MAISDLDDFLDRWPRAVYNVESNIEPRQALAEITTAQRLLEAYDVGLGRKP